MSDIKQLPGTTTGAADPAKVQEAVYGDKVDQVYANGFTVNITDMDGVLAVGLMIPGQSIMRYTHRIHMPLKTIRALHSGLTQILSTMDDAKTAVHH